MLTLTCIAISSFCILNMSLIPQLFSLWINYSFDCLIGPAEGEEESFTHQLRGVIPRAFEYLFSLINREQEKVVRMLFLVDITSKSCSVQWSRCRHSLVL